MSSYDLIKTQRAIMNTRPKNEHGEEYVTKIRGRYMTQEALDQLLDRKMPDAERAFIKREALKNWIEEHNEIIDTSSWRIKSRTASMMNFTDEKKSRWLYELSKHGQHALADAAVGVSAKTRRDHLENDVDFATAEEEVISTYSALQVRIIETQAIEGELSFQYDKDGKVVGETRRFETPLRLAIIKRHDKRFVEKQEVEHKVTGGVLLMPAAATPSVWEQEVAKIKAGNPVLPPGDPMKLDVPNILDAEFSEANHDPFSPIQPPPKTSAPSAEPTSDNEGGLHNPVLRAAGEPGTNAGED